jgi:hypothetical protein
VKFETIPVLDPDGNVQLYDMYIDDEWCGSFRKLEYCEEFFKRYESKNK